MNVSFACRHLNGAKMSRACYGGVALPAVDIIKMWYAREITASARAETRIIVVVCVGSSMLRVSLATNMCGIKWRRHGVLRGFAALRMKCALQLVLIERKHPFLIWPVDSAA